MVRLLLSMLSVTVLTMLLPAATAPAQAATPLRVLLVGDSVTQGSAGDWTWRYRLWQEFQRQEVAVDFVGPRDDLYDNVTDEHGSQAYLDANFDRDHAARWGAAFGFEERRIDDLVNDYRPDVVVVMLGINNMTFFGQDADQVRDDLHRFVNSARSADDGVEMVIGKAPQTWLHPEVASFNAAVDQLAHDLPRTAAADTATDVVDGVDTWDHTHPSATGEIKIAAAMTDALAELGHLAPARRPLPEVTNGPRVPPSLTATRRADTAELAWTLPPGATAAYVWQRPDRGRWSRLPDEHATDALSIPVPRGARVEFRVQPIKGSLPAARDAHSDVVSVTSPPVPGPRHLRLQAKGRRLVAIWSQRRDATRYRVHVRTGRSSWKAAGWSATSRWKSAPLTPGRLHRVRVQSYDGIYSGGLSTVQRLRP